MADRHTEAPVVIQFPRARGIAPTPEQCSRAAMERLVHSIPAEITASCDVHQVVTQAERRVVAAAALAHVMFERMVNEHLTGIDQHATFEEMVLNSLRAMKNKAGML